MIDDLYNIDILSLASTLRNERLVTPQGTSRQVSKLCGSWVEIDVNVDGSGFVADVAMRVQACALGQASAAILTANVIGATLDDLEAGRDGLRAMLKTNAPPPEGRFGDLKKLLGVRDYPARHTSTMLAFDAAVEAVKMAQMS